MGTDSLSGVRSATVVQYFYSGMTSRSRIGSLGNFGGAEPLPAFRLQLGSVTRDLWCIQLLVVAVAPLFRP